LGCAEQAKSFSGPHFARRPYVVHACFKLLLLHKKVYRLGSFPAFFPPLALETFLTRFFVLVSIEEFLAGSIPTLRHFLNRHFLHQRLLDDLLHVPPFDKKNILKCERSKTFCSAMKADEWYH
jgi:hypothetical protein